MLYDIPQAAPIYEREFSNGSYRAWVAHWPEKPDQWRVFYHSPCCNAGTGSLSRSLEAAKAHVDYFIDDLAPQQEAARQRSR